MTSASSDTALLPRCLKPGDRVRLVSPASTPSEDGVHRCVSTFESWGLRVELGKHVFSRLGYLAGTDEERVTDVNEALRDEGIRAIFATTGGKGSYRIADRLDFKAAAANPKFVVGFSDITALHLALYRACRLVGVHGPLSSWSAEFIGPASVDALRKALTTTDPIDIHPDPGEPTRALTTKGHAVGRLIGGNLDTLAICAGWALPSLDGSILFIEAADMGLGHVDRQLTMLTKAGHLKGIRGIAVGQFVNYKTGDHGWSVLDVLRDHFGRIGVPILGGLPIGHGKNPKTIPIGTQAMLDADAGKLHVAAGSRSSD
jgi:muramoyltetrapeptide carboxypeptidase